MLSSLLGRVITGPVAFLLAGVYDLTTFFARFAVRSLHARARAWTHPEGAERSAEGPEPQRRP